MIERVSTVNTASPYLKYLVATFPKEAARAVRHVAWFLREELKRTFDAPGGKALPKKTRISQEIQDATTLLLGGTNRGRKRAKRKRELAGKVSDSILNRRAVYPALGGRLRVLVRYQFDAQAKKATIGWLNDKAAMRGEMFQNGRIQKVTPRMRRLYNLIGRRISRRLNVPERPVIEPFFNANRAEIPRRMEQRILEYLQKANSRAVTRVASTFAGKFLKGVV